MCETILRPASAVCSVRRAGADHFNLRPASRTSGGSRTAPPRARRIRGGADCSASARWWPAPSERRQLDGRVALVTGAGAGIGEGIARRFAEEGARVVVAELDEAVRPGRGRGGRRHVRGLRRVGPRAGRGRGRGRGATYGSIDVVVNNAWGGGSMSRVERKTDEALLHGMRVGYLGPYWAMTAALPHMKERGWGRVINMCSLNGVNAHMGSLEYNAAKEALRALTRTAAREWAPTGVTVNAICPAAKSQAFFRAIGDYPELEALADAANPMGRMGDAYADIAPVAVFLASEGSGYLTGNTLFVDGGSHINGAAWAPDLDAVRAEGSGRPQDDGEPAERSRGPSRRRASRAITTESDRVEHDVLPVDHPVQPEHVHPGAGPQDHDRAEGDPPRRGDGADDGWTDQHERDEEGVDRSRAGREAGRARAARTICLRMVSPDQVGTEVIRRSPAYGTPRVRRCPDRLPLRSEARIPRRSVQFGPWRRRADGALEPVDLVVGPGVHTRSAGRDLGSGPARRRHGPDPAAHAQRAQPGDLAAAGRAALGPWAAGLVALDGRGADGPDRDAARGTGQPRGHAAGRLLARPARPPPAGYAGIVPVLVVRGQRSARRLADRAFVAHRARSRVGGRSRWWAAAATTSRTWRRPTAPASGSACSPRRRAPRPNANGSPPSCTTWSPTGSR